MKKIIMLIIGCVMAGLLGCSTTNIENLKDFDVTAGDTGLVITKNNSMNLRRIEICVKQSSGQYNLMMETELSASQVIYPFVEKDKEYTVYLKYTDQSWKTSESDRLTVKAKGGLGDFYVTLDGYEYDNQKAQIKLNNYQIHKPKDVFLLSESYSGNLWFDYEKDNPWGTAKTQWGKYEYNLDENALELGDNLSVIKNKEFFVDIDYNAVFENTNYRTQLIQNSSNPFVDSHSISNVSLSDGILRPIFNPSICDYKILGTKNPVEITVTNNEKDEILQLENKNGSKVYYSHGEGDKKLTYNFEFVECEEIDFNGQNYIQTFYDDFEGNELNSSNWKRVPEQERQANMEGHGFWKNECSYLEEGKLVIEAKVENGYNISGGVKSEGLFEQSKGLYEIKFKCEDTSGLWYAFWLMGDNDENHIDGSATDAAEIDCFELIPNEGNSKRPNKEYGTPNAFKSTIHWDAYGDAHKSKSSNPINVVDFDEDFYKNYHVFQFLWGEDSYQAYMDGKHLWTMDASTVDEEHFGGMCNGRNYMKITSEFGNWGGDLDKTLLPAKMYVDYVKVYKASK